MFTLYFTEEEEQPDKWGVAEYNTTEQGLHTHLTLKNTKVP